MAPSTGRRGGLLSARALSGYARIVSSGACTAAAGLRSAGASLVSSIAGADDDAASDQVRWAAFDKLELNGKCHRQVLLLAYNWGFQVWDVEQADEVRQLTYRHDGPVSLMQFLKKPIASKKVQDRFSDVGPVLLVVCDETSTEKELNHEDDSHQTLRETGKDNFPSFVRFYSLRVQDYVHEMKFRSAIFSVRCGPRVFAVSQACQIHCFDAATLEREYTLLTNPVPLEISSPGDIGCGPLAVGPRWLAYSGPPVVVPDTGRVSPQQLGMAGGMPLTPSINMVAHYAKESSKHLATSIATLGDMGYKKLTKYCSEMMSNSNGTTKLGNLGSKANGTTNRLVTDNEFAGMVIVRDIVSKFVIVQFRAHTSPISALCFDPSGTLLVTASIHGRNINVFRIMPSLDQSSESGINGTCVHLYKLQRGITNAVIKDISFSDDSEWIMISSSRGTSHLFAISPYGGSTNYQYSNNIPVNFADPNLKRALSFPQNSQSLSLHKKTLLMSPNPVTLSVVSRIRNGSNLLKGAVSGAAAFATGSVNPISGAIASAFHNSRGSGPYSDMNSMLTRYHLLVFSPSGSIIQYVLHRSSEGVPGADPQISGYPYGAPTENDARFIVEALQKWDVCTKRNRKDHVEIVDICEYFDKEDIQPAPKGFKRATYPSIDSSFAKHKQTTEENHHIHISGVELQTHVVQHPLWSKPGICFQPMVAESFGQSCSPVGGENEVEKFPTHSIEAKSKSLIPVFDPWHTLRYQQARSNSLNANRHSALLRQKSALSDGVSCSSRLSPRGSSCSATSADCMSEGAAVHTDASNAIDVYLPDQSLKEEPAVDAVNNLTRLSDKCPTELVQSLATQAQLEPAPAAFELT